MALYQHGENELFQAGAEDNDEDERDQCDRLKRPPVIPYESIQWPYRLSTHHKTALDKVMDTLEKPEGFLPKTLLPTWPEMHLDSRIPSVPAPKGFFLFSKGNICQNIFHQTPYYTVEDPENHDMITHPYNALHDPHAVNYMNNPEVQRKLIDQKLVSSTGIVNDELKQFNDYRRYLHRHVFVPQVREAFADKDECQKHDIQMQKEIHYYISATEGKLREQRNQKEKAENQQKLKRATQLAKHREKLRREAENDLRYRAQVQARDTALLLRGIKNDERREQIRNTKRLEEIARRAELIARATTKELEAAERLVEDKSLTNRAFVHFHMEWLNAKFEFGKDRMGKEALINDTIENGNAARAHKRQKRIEKLRADLPERIKKRKAGEARLWAIVRKYFNRWRDVVRMRKARRPDAQHKSLWEAPEIMEPTVKYLRKESGYEKLDDFILNIVKLKRDIKAELEAEEAAEREAAKNAAGGSPQASNLDTSAKEGDEQKTDNPAAALTSSQKAMLLGGPIPEETKASEGKPSDTKSVFKPDDTKSVFKPLDDTKSVFKPADDTKSVFKPLDDTKSVFKPSDTKSVFKPLDDGKSVVKPSDAKSVFKSADDTKSVFKPLDDGKSVVKPSDAKSVFKPSDTKSVFKSVDDTKSVFKPLDDGKSVVKPSDTKSVFKDDKNKKPDGPGSSHAP